MDCVQFLTQGYARIPQVLGSGECEIIAAHLCAASKDTVGARRLLSLAWCNLLATRIRQHPALAALIPTAYAATQCTYFEKSPFHNWLVAVHQDLSIPVAERMKHPSLKGWSEKEGVLYVQAPIDLMAQLIAVRVHVDACGANDGPLRVVPGSHLGGTIDPETAAARRQSEPEPPHVTHAGSVLVMRPLLLHASSKSQGYSQRRVLHFLFGPRTLPLGLRWHHQV